MKLTALFAVGIITIHYSLCSYIILAPSEIHRGWTYKVQVFVNNATGPVSITGDINYNNVPVATNSTTVANGHSVVLDIPIGTSLQGGLYKLQLKGSGGGIAFNSSTSVTMDIQSYLTFIQTDKSIYKPGQLVRFRVVCVDKDLIPQAIPFTIKINNPKGSTLARMENNGSLVFDGEFQLAEFPDIGTWVFIVTSSQAAIEQRMEFDVEEYVLPKFEVTAQAVPDYLVQGNGMKSVTVDVSAKYTYGKGVMGNVKLSVIHNTLTQEIHSKIEDASGKKSILVDLTKEVTRAYSGQIITIQAEVTDETMRTYQTTTTLRVELYPVKVAFDLTKTDQVYRPGMKFTAVAKFTDPSGGPMSKEFSSKTVILSLSEPMSSTNLYTAEAILELGQQEITLNVPVVNSSVDSLTLKAELLGFPYSAVSSIRKFATKGPATLKIIWDPANMILTVGQQVSFTVQTLGEFSSLSYLIVSRGSIQAVGNLTAGQVITLTVSTDMCPNGQLIVYGVAPHNPEVIGDSVSLKLTHCQDKVVTPSLTQTTQRSGTDATVNLAVAWSDKSRVDTVGVHDVYMVAIDKSVILLRGDDNNLNPKRIEKGLSEFDLPTTKYKNNFMMSDVINPYSGGVAASTTEIIQDAGLVFLTDLPVTSQTRYPVYFDMAPNKEAKDVMDDGIMFKSAGTQSKSVPTVPTPVTVRKDFPDTWIWESIRTNDGGHFSLTKKLPDTITSWVISAFAVRQSSELAVTATPFELNAFLPFFVTLNLPYSIRRSEKFELRATVFNYETVPANVQVTLAESSEFTVSGSNVKTVIVNSNLAGSVVFTISATTVGTITLNVTAEVLGTSTIDAVSKKLIVKPEGVERMRAITFPVILTADQPTFEKDIILDFTPWTLSDIVEDSRRAMVKVTGDMMGNVLEDIDKLVQMPFGCGEQNMITTVPNIYALTYLNAINDVPPGFAEKAKGYMRAGYNKQTQQYRYTNGAYSAFGERQDNAGSTWLTAFVLKSFAQANQFINDTVDSLILESAATFVLSMQQNDGSFRESGRVIHTEMQATGEIQFSGNLTKVGSGVQMGGTAAGDPLTVYVVICLLEAKKYGVAVNERKLSSAISYIKSKADGGNMKGNNFLSALTAYALALNNPSDPAVPKLLQGIISAGAPWLQKEDSSGNDPVIQPRGMYYQPPSGPSDIEITAYCLLTYNTMKQHGEGHELLLWLQRQQNSDGGFRSTQDTVMALQAISEFALYFRNSNPTASVTVTPLDPPEKSTSVDININNAVLLQFIELPDETNQVRVKVTGNTNSLAVVKVVWFFYTAPGTAEQPSKNNSKNKLVVTTSMTPLRVGFNKIQACIKIADDLDYDKMAVLTFELPSGHTLDNIEQARTDNPGAVRLELDKDKVHLYMTSLHEDCMNLIVEETVKVENLKPGNAILYAYYQPDVKAEAQIQLQAKCTGSTCEPSSVGTKIGGLVLSACICLLVSLVFAV